MDNNQLSKNQLLNVIFEETESDLGDEQIIHLLMEEKVSSNTVKKEEEHDSNGQKWADRIAKFAGSWTFILIFVSVLVFWMVLNSVLLLTKAFDPYPFILLNLVLSCVAAIQAPLILMSQNRQEEKDRTRAENDYKVNLKSEFMTRDLHQKMDLILENQERLFKALESDRFRTPPRP